MKLRIKTTSGILEVSSTWAKQKRSNWGSSFDQHNRVRLRFAHNEDIEVCGEEDAFVGHVFDYWGSKNDPELKTEYDLGNAALGIIQEANCANSKYEDFCGDLGYEPFLACGHCKNPVAEGVYQECKGLKFNLPMPTNEDFLCDMLNELSETYG